MPYFCHKTALFGDFDGVFSFINAKSAFACPDKTEVADFVSFKGSIVQGIKILKLFFKNLLTIFKKRVY